MSFNTQHCLNYLEQKVDYEIMARAIEECGADIVGLNEMFDNSHLEDYDKQTEKIAKSTTLPYFFFAKAIDDGMGEYVADQVVKLMLKKGIQVLGSKILVLGFTFKENCPDVRNTKVIDIIKTLEEYNADVTIYDPWANPAIAKHEYGVVLQNELPDEVFDAVILAVAHNEFKSLDLKQITNGVSVVYDVKGILSEEVIDGKL